MISSQHEAFGRLTTRLKNKCKSENIFGGASVRVFMCATIYRSWNIFASDDGQNVALFLCFTITSYNHDRRLQMWSWKPTWQRLRHPSPPRPPPPPPSQTKVSRVMMRMMVFFVFASLVRIFGWVHWLYIDGDKCSSMQRLANVTTHSVLVAWKSPRSQERWKISSKHHILSIKRRKKWFPA